MFHLADLHNTYLKMIFLFAKYEILISQSIFTYTSSSLIKFIFTTF